MTAPNPSDIPADIRKRVEDDFGADKCETIYQRMLDRIPDGLSNGTRPRHLRCILFLAKGDEQELDKFINFCLRDTRDVMSWAEYESNVRNRDFSKPFELATIDQS